MNTDIKILLSIKLQGGTLHRSSEPEIREALIRKKDLNPNAKWKNKEGDKIVKKVKYKVYPLVQSEATLSKRICVEAYKYMTSTEVPVWFTPTHNPRKDVIIWRNMDAISRLEQHLSRICEHFNGLSYTYSIIDE